MGTEGGGRYHVGEKVPELSWAQFSPSQANLNSNLPCVGTLLRTYHWYHHSNPLHLSAKAWDFSLGLLRWDSFPALSVNIFSSRDRDLQGESALTNEEQVILAVLFLEAPFAVEQFKRIHTGRARGRTSTVHLLPPLLCILGISWLSQPALVLPFLHFKGINFWILTDFLSDSFLCLTHPSKGASEIPNLLIFRVNHE